MVAARAPHACLLLRPRFDLRTGRPAGARIEAGFLSTPRQAQEALEAAGARAGALGLGGALSLPLGERLSFPAQAQALCEAAQAAGFAPGALTFEIEERALIARAATLAEELRARGWRVALRGDPLCPLPFGAKARGLYQEVVVTAARLPSPFLGVGDGERDPLGRRILAAREAGLTLTVEGVGDAHSAKLWLLAGFDRAEGEAFGFGAVVDQAPMAAAGRGPSALSFSSR